MEFNADDREEARQPPATPARRSPESAHPANAGAPAGLGGVEDDSLRGVVT